MDNELNKQPDASGTPAPGQPQQDPISIDVDQEGSLGDQNQKKSEKNVGAVVGIIIIIAIIVIGGIYFWGKQNAGNLQIEDHSGEMTDEPGGNTSGETAGINTLPQQSDSIDLSDIEADLKAANFDNLGAGFSDIEAELNAE